MPQYRRLYSKIRDSADVNDMPNDFCRLAWTWLPCTLDSEGRCYDDPQWLRSVLFPKRRDVTAEMVSDALDWWAERKMIVRYTVNGEGFFWVPSFKEYQTGTDKEAKSLIPPPNKKSIRSRVTPELVESKSGPTPELVQNYSASDSDSDSDAKVANATALKKNPTREIQDAYQAACGYPVKWSAGEGKAAKWLSVHGYTAAQVAACYEFLKAQEFWKDKALSLQSLSKQIGAFVKANGARAPDDGIDWNKYGMTPSGKVVLAR